ncbi:hypothetical protein BHE74_00021539 [Ensete ventricosum]|nr:hypothetical protein BHE74_00021539 [Ensete ventricosum]RZS00429.1 hypothetical protein BHM03_00030126 [Ensete ventricosum]
MADSSGSLDYWRKFFRSANSDIFQVIEHAVLVAASDYPEEFRSRRDRMVEKLFTVLLPRCFGCDRVAEGEEWNASVKRDGEKESKVDSNNVGPEDLNRIVSNYSFDEAEALTEEIEEEGQIVGEVLRIKDIFANHHDEVCAIAPLINSTSLLSFCSLMEWMMTEVSNCAFCLVMSFADALPSCSISTIR